jgi:hypothetical protein
MVVLGMWVVVRRVRRDPAKLGLFARGVVGVLEVLNGSGLSGRLVVNE